MAWRRRRRVPNPANWPRFADNWLLVNDRKSARLVVSAGFRRWRGWRGCRRWHRDFGRVYGAQAFSRSIVARTWLGCIYSYRPDCLELVLRSFAPLGFCFFGGCFGRLPKGRAATSPPPRSRRPLSLPESGEIITLSERERVGRQGRPR